MIFAFGLFAGLCVGWCARGFLQVKHEIQNRPDSGLPAAFLDGMVVEPGSPLFVVPSRTADRRVG